MFNTILQSQYVNERGTTFVIEIARSSTKANFYRLRFIPKAYYLRFNTGTCSMYDGLWETRYTYGLTTAIQYIKWQCEHGLKFMEFTSKG